MFNPGNKLRHVNCLDVDLVVLHKEDHEEHVELEVLYWNHRYNHFCVDEPDTVTIAKKDFPKWRIIND